MKRGRVVYAVTVGLIVAGLLGTYACRDGGGPAGPALESRAAVDEIIDLEKATNGHDADMPPGPTITVGDPVVWTYVVTNTGTETLMDVVVTDDDPSLTVACPKSSLDPGESMTCTANGVAQQGQYKNVAMVTAGPVDPVPEIWAADTSHYYGEAPEADEGCSLGYWKNHSRGWPAGYTPGQSVQSVFSGAASYPDVGAASLLEALRFKGGPTVEAKARLLVKQAVAAVLNAAHPDVDYPWSVADVQAKTNNALAGGEHHMMLELKDDFDMDNNLGCPLSNDEFDRAIEIIRNRIDQFGRKRN